VRTISDTVDAKDMKGHQEIVAYFDGKEYEVKGAAMPTTRAYKRTDRDYEYVTRVNGKVTTTSRGAVSADGNVRTLTTTGTNADGQAQHSPGDHPPERRPRGSVHAPRPIDTRRRRRVTWSAQIMVIETAEHNIALQL
jgi:hypothetical protein